LASGIHSNPRNIYRWQFATNVISESEHENLIKVELSDVKKDDVKIAVANGIITITALVPVAIPTDVLTKGGRIRLPATPRPTQHALHLGHPTLCSSFTVTSI
jgi:HSP20 family molecular chaperone IbpA